MTAEPSPLLELADVEKRYAGEIALCGVDLRLAAGECLALVGESGSGKSTLLRLCNRLLDPTAGTVFLQGRDIATLDPVALRRRIGYVQQEGGLIPHWTVAKNVGLVPRLLGWSPEDRDDQIRNLLQLVELDPDRYGSRFPSQLSGGQRQRVAVARALAGRPELVLFDEPFGALDVITRDELQRRFVTLREVIPTTCVLVTHDLGEALRLGDRVAVLRGGRLLVVATPDELLHRSDDEYVQRLVETARRSW